ncbi:MAG: hypothetical protein KFKLKKLM_01239 [Flavobacteriales bacterium]|nr:hypothetical protein [Flavobacteriales bacterium]
MKNKKILFLLPYPVKKAPSQRLKFEQYFSVFINANYDITTNSFISDKLWHILYKPRYFLKKFIFTFFGYINRIKILFSLRKYDLVYIHLWVTPMGTSFFEFIVCLISKKIVYDIDDMVFLGHSSEANKYFQRIKGKNKMIYLMRKANHVITCTPKLDEFVKQFNSNTTDISSTVDTKSNYIPINNYKNDHQIIIGWSGSHSTSKYLYLLENVFQELAKKYNYKLIVIGDSNFDIKGVDVESYNWSEEIEVATLQKFDIGVYPLPDEEWVYGKSGLKAIQYMALGIPTIATAIGANYRIINDGINGYLVSTNNFKLWKKRLEQLITSENLRERLGKEGRKTIEEHYSIEANKDKYLAIFNSLLG